MSIVQILEAIKSDSSKIGKLNLLTKERDNDLFKQVLSYAYTPTQKFYTKGKGLVGTGTGTLEDTFYTWSALLEDLAERNLSGNAAMAAIANLFRTLSPADAQVFLNILNKDLRAGIGLAFINKAFPGLIEYLQFMKAQKYTLGDMSKYKYLYMSLKIDCIRGLLRNGTIFSTNGRIIPGVQHLSNGIPPGIDLDMEITIPGYDFDTASGLIRSNKKCNKAVGKVFDIPSVKGAFHTRYKELVEMMETYVPKHLELIVHKTVSDEDVMFRNYKKALTAGFEGLVLKTPNHLYQLKRSSDWLKVKPEDPESVRIVGFNPGTGKYAGTLGSVACERKNGKIVNVGGFPDILRDQIWNNKEHWDGAIIDIRSHMETPDGSLRHPRFYRERWDLRELS